MNNTKQIKTTKEIIGVIISFIIFYTIFHNWNFIESLFQ